MTSNPPLFDPTQIAFNAAGLVPVIAQEAHSKQVLMMAWMNALALQQTLASGRMTYWSRSRKALWVKGETSGHRQDLVELRYDCDGDCLLALVRQHGAACHTNRRSCFYRAIRAGARGEWRAEVIEAVIKK